MKELIGLNLSLALTVNELMSLELMVAEQMKAEGLIKKTLDKGLFSLRQLPLLKPGSDTWDWPSYKNRYDRQTDIFRLWLENV